MRREGRRYSSYRGRATATDKLRITAIILFILVLLASAALMYGQRYIVYTDDGLRVDLPFLQREEAQKPEEDLGEVKVVVEPEKSTPDTPEVPAVQEQEPLRAIELSLDAVADGTALEQARAQGANAIILQMKDDFGQLGFYSDQTLVSQVGANVQAQAINDAIQALAQEDIILIARMSCFRDHRLADDLAYAIETNPGRRWFDLGSVRWSNPAKEGVRIYLTGLARELAELGFDEIVLENWGYPTQEDGHLEYIKKGEFYDLEQLDGVIASFLQEMENSLEGTETVLSLKSEDSVMRGVQDQSGRTLEQLAALGGRIWLADSPGAAQGLESAGMQDAAGHLVKIVSVLEGTGEEHQAVLKLQ